MERGSARLSQHGGRRRLAADVGDVRLGVLLPRRVCQPNAVAGHVRRQRVAVLKLHRVFGQRVQFIEADNVLVVVKDASSAGSAIFQSPQQPLEFPRA